MDVRRTLWRFAALPLGWSLSPYYFCTHVTVMMRHLRQPDFATAYFRSPRPPYRRLCSRKTRGVCLLPFVDGFPFLAATEAQALRACVR